MNLWFKGRGIKSNASAVLILLVVLFIIPAGSWSGETPNDSNEFNPGINVLLLDSNDDMVTITGEFREGQATNNWFKKYFSGFPAQAYALEPTDVSQVIVFFTNGNYLISDVVDGSFSLDVEKGSPAGMIFAGASSNYLGYLTLGNGIDSLPLNYDENNVETIDLGTLIEAWGQAHIVLSLFVNRNS